MVPAGRKKEAKPQKRSPLKPGGALQAAVERLLKGLDAGLQVHAVAQSVLVSINGAGVVQIGARGVRFLPGDQWERLSLSNGSEAAAIRRRVAALISERGLASPGATGAHTHSAQDWASALAVRGVPAKVVSAGVDVDGIGLVPLPAADVSLRKAAKRFIREQTQASMPWILEQVQQAAGNDVRVRVTSAAGHISVRFGQDQLATVSRFRVALSGSPPTYGDLKADPRPLEALAKAVARALGQPAPTDTTAPFEADPDQDAVRPPDDSNTDESQTASVREYAGLDDVADFLEEAGLHAAVSARSRLVVAGLDLHPPASTMQDSQRCQAWLDALVAEQFSVLLEGCAREALASLPVRLASVAGEFVVLDPSSRRIARISATRVTLSDDRVFDGNFLIAGAHWQPVTAALDEITLTYADQPVAEPGIHRSLPADTDPVIVAAAREASRRLRDERVRGFDYAIRVDVADASLLFSRLTMVDGRALIPFVYERSEGILQGSFRLSAVDQLLACMWQQLSDTETLATVWTLALGAYADLTCAAQAVPDRRPRQEGSLSPPARGAGRRRAPARATSREADPDPAKLPAQLRPRGDTARYASIVAGHIRRLPPPKQHSPEAAANAARFHIRLRPGETWVQPYIRGIPTNMVLHFAWTAPAWVRNRSLPR